MCLIADAFAIAVNVTSIRKDSPCFSLFCFSTPFPQRWFILAFLHPPLRFAYSTVSLPSNTRFASMRQLWLLGLHLPWLSVIWAFTSLSGTGAYLKQTYQTCVLWKGSVLYTLKPLQETNTPTGEMKWRFSGGAVSNRHMTTPNQTSGVNTVIISRVWDTVSLSHLPLLSLSTPLSHLLRSVSTTLKMPSDFSAIPILNLEHAKSSWT